MSDRIMLVAGPPGAGKSTIARRLALALGRPVVSVDLARIRAYPRLGHSPARARRLLRTGGVRELMRHESRFAALLLADLVRQRPATPVVLDLDGGVLYQPEVRYRELVRDVLRVAGHRLLALPHPNDPAVSTRSYSGGCGSGPCPTLEPPVGSWAAVRTWPPNWWLSPTSGRTTLSPSTRVPRSRNSCRRADRGEHAAPTEAARTPLARSGGDA